jgi:hypothetical protein
MRDFIIPTGIGLAASVGWLAIWTLALRAFHIAYFARTPEETAARRERIIGMGKRRYILIFGVLGFGLAFGLGIAIAGIVAHESAGWVGAAIKVVLVSLLGGWWHGARTWNESFRGEVPFPPPFLFKK